MLNADEILGMNARNLLYVSQNTAKAKQICNSKLKTKLLMNENEIAAPQVYKIMSTGEDIESYDWGQHESNFVIKPTNGSGGKGIVVLRKQVRPGVWVDAIGQEWAEETIKLHCLDILEGKYSSRPSASDHQILIEERVPIHNLFLKYSYGGTPDIRVIVYNGVPVMAMLRLPTKESEGRANLHQGAIAAGIDLATGITTYAIPSSGTPLKYVPGTKRKLNGIRIPFWKQTLLTAVKAANISGLTYGGIDLFMHQEKGPMVVEMNARPGLSIQLANQKGLKKRLRRIDGLSIINPEHGVKIAQTLFMSELIDKVIDKENPPIIGFNEEITLLGSKENGKKKTKEIQISARVDTSRFRSSISREIAEELGIYHPDNLLWFQPEAESDQNTLEKAPVIEVTFVMAGRKVTTSMVISKQLDRGKTKVRLGRADLSGFMVTNQS